MRKIYLDLQEDEIEMTHEHFRKIYYSLMESLNEKEDFTIASFLNELDQELVNNISSILMEEEKYRLDNWESKDIYPKSKRQQVSQEVTETILSLRCHLINKRINELQRETQDIKEDNRDTLEEVINYQKLKVLLSDKLSRVLS